MSFDQAFARTVGAEGAYSDNPKDPGGATMYGITEAVARAHGYKGAMKDMPLLAAKDIYRQSYWLLIHLDVIDSISPPVAEEMFDTGVNCGADVPVPFLQRALNAFNRQGTDYPDVKADGLFGAMTASALKAFLAKRGKDEQLVLLTLLNAQQAIRYLEIVEKRPASEPFFLGWIKNRVAA